MLQAHLASTDLHRSTHGNSLFGVTDLPQPQHQDKTESEDSDEKDILKMELPLYNLLSLHQRQPG